MTDDLDRMMDIMERAFDPQWGEAWNRRQLSDSLAMPHTEYVLIGDDGEPLRTDGVAAGFILIKTVAGEEELLLIAIDPRHRGKGLGTVLLNIFIADARARKAERVFLEMRANNPAAALYRAAGFEQVGLRKDYYSTGDGNTLDAITFGKSL